MTSPLTSTTVVNGLWGAGMIAADRCTDDLPLVGWHYFNLYRDFGVELHFLGLRAGSLLE